MKKSLSRVVSFLTAFLILFAGSAFHAAADNSLTTEELVILPISDIPEVISYEDAIERGHVERLKSEETDMHSVIFRNSDGTKSLYMFASPVKYTASNGSVKDKSTDISITANGFAVTDNDVKLTFGNSSTNATTVVNNGNTVMITPNGMNNADGILQNNTMVYNGVFGSNTMLVYTPLLSGLKAGIILKTQGDVTGFSFDLEAIGLTPSASTNGVINLNNTDNETVFEIGTYLVTDANGKYTEGEMLLSGNATDGYTVTANVDEAFLNAADTAYPVIVEPNITLNTSSAIDDAVIYSEKPNKAYGAYKYNNIGYLDSYGVGRLLVKFPGLENNDTFNSLTAPQIRSAEYCMYTASSGTSTQLNTQDMDALTWEEASVTWSMLGEATTSTMYLSRSDYIPTTAASLLKTNILGLIKLYKIDGYSLANGIVMLSADESSSTVLRDFCSTEYADLNNGNLMPYFALTYGDSVEYAQANIKILIDEAFQSRCEAIYPTLPSNLAVTRRLTELLNSVIQMYKERFEIQLEIITVQKVTTSIDQCPQASDLDSVCQCEYDPPYLYHHTNQMNILYSLPSGDADNYCNLFFTGHKTCSHPGTLCTDATGSGITLAPNHKTAIFSCATNSTINDTHISLTIAHEIGHLFYVEDHYNQTGTNDDAILKPGQNHTCVWGDQRHYDNIASNFTMCKYCKNVLYTNKYLYNHS